ncbi:hypothetical protein [Pectinatus frisingensis]|uniref:hypothetical protein n=1 Tax=Pectinatus frisingensis TaxID=865 RepID=UPI0015F49AC9|nr:hypothetical protein [Pectinatus frisingensis]
MFYTREQEKAEEIYNKAISTPTRIMIANSIFSGCKIALDIFQDKSNLLIPGSAYYDSAFRLGFIINKILVHQINDNEFCEISYFEPDRGHGRRTIEYKTNNVTIQLKKTNKRNKLPEPAKYRLKKAADNQMILDFGKNYNIADMYMLVTYTHRRLVLDYIQIGMPNEDYTGWLNSWDLLQYIQKEQTERIVQNYGTQVQEEYQEAIEKKYKISLK